MSHTATLLTVKRMGINHKAVLDWRHHLSGSTSAAIPSANVTEESGGDNNDDQVQEDHSDNDSEVVPEASKECRLPNDKTVSLIGDNLDKGIKPRDMRISNQVQSLHLFHSCAAVSQLETLHLDDETLASHLDNVPVSAFLPSITDCADIQDNYVVLRARVIATHLSCSSTLRTCVPEHIYTTRIQCCHEGKKCSGMWYNMHERILHA